MKQKWICNKCGFETEEKPQHKNSTCPKCGKGRFQGWNQCECGNWFHPQRLEQRYCSKEGANKKEIAKLIDRDQNDLLQYMQTGDKHGQEAFCFGGYIFKKDHIAAAQMSEPEY